MVTPTATPIPTVDWPMTFSFNAKVVVVAAGAEVVAVAGDPSMQRWSPLLVGLSRASF
jgi:hypothetical protein